MSKNPIIFALQLALGDKSGSFDIVHRHISNWHELPLVITGMKNSIWMRTRDGRKYNITIKNNFVEMDYKKRKVRFVYSKRSEIVHILLMLIGEFIVEPHKGLNVKGRKVVDIGAYIADTAIYFALNGAKHVYAIEPYPHSCEIAMRNINANNLQKRITLINAGCGSKRGTMIVNPEFENLAGAEIKQSRSGKEIRIITLEWLVKKYNLRSAALKIDCEGCEYDIISGTQAGTLKKFQEMLIEYHYGYEPLAKKLQDIGFRTKHTQPETSYNANTKERKMSMGDIHASLGE
ncbi:MAG: FkbM family methyltransferase [Candidatus Micrarchaeales archaeon]